MKFNTTLNFPWIKCFFPGLSNHQKFSLYIYSKPFTDWTEGPFYQDLNKLKYEKVHLGLSKLVWNNLNGTTFNRKDRVAAALISLCWWQSMFEKLVEALTTKPVCRMAQWKCWVHGVQWSIVIGTKAKPMHPCEASPGKGKHHQLQILQLSLLSLTWRRQEWYYKHELWVRC